jgi:hypothetical protein
MQHYTSFREERNKLGDFAPHAPYHWWNLPDTLPIGWFAYAQFLEEHAQELSNSINELRRLLASLMAWEKLLPRLEEKVLLKTIIEHVSPTSTLALLMPSVIRARFIYSIAHLSHQANMLMIDDWTDDLPIDTEIHFNQADQYGRQWSSYSPLKAALERIANREYSASTYDFRNSFSHRYSPRIEIGLTGLVSRNISKKGKVSYGFGETQPLKLSDIVPLLLQQHSNCITAYMHYQQLVNEQTSAIAEHISE